MRRLRPSLGEDGGDGAAWPDYPSPSRLATAGHVHDDSRDGLRQQPDLRVYMGYGGDDTDG